ncbi:MAG: Mur ligase family protein [Owenweeksia sp.]|nr:Mur ligase family protein [Owenweeksia sp.]
MRGKNHDGHHHIRELIEKGVCHFVVEELPESEYDECNFLIVPDSLKALQQLAAAVRSKFAGPVVAITGSNGKTVVKEWLWQVLNSQLAVCRSPKSYNSQVGVPLSVWELGSQHQLAVFEAGISQPGEMEHLADILRPQYGIFTNIGTAHQEGFENATNKIVEN